MNQSLLTDPGQLPDVRLLVAFPDDDSLSFKQMQVMDDYIVLEPAWTHNASNIRFSLLQSLQHFGSRYQA
jgi:hypothetical protein